MLSKKNIKPARVKQLLAVPLLLLCLVCFTKNAFSDGKREMKGNTLSYRGNVFEMLTFPNDTVMVEDPLTAEWTMMIATRAPKPVRLNGKQIFTADEVDNEPELTDNNIRKYIMKNISDDLPRLGDGEYTMFISNIVMNTEGEIVLFDYDGIREYYTAQIKTTNAKQKKSIDSKIAKLIHNVPRLKPAMLNGNAVHCLMENGAFDKHIIIKNGQLIVQ